MTEVEKEEIEVTPEMIEAGEYALTGELGGAVTCHWNAASLAKEVFEAMWTVGPEWLPPIRKRSSEIS